MQKTTLAERKRMQRKLYIKDNWQMYVMILIPIAFVILFKYAAYPGLRIAFMNYKPAKGFSGSEWVGFQIFEKIFKDRDFIRALKNSLAFNFLEQDAGTAEEILIAVLGEDTEVTARGKGVDHHRAFHELEVTRRGVA